MRPVSLSVVAFELRLAGAPARHVQVTLSSASTSERARAASSSAGLGLLAIVVADGISLKGRGGNVAPGCMELGPGLAIPRRDGAQDLAALRACARRLKDAAPELAAERAVRVTANADVPFSDVLGVIEALRGERLELFPDVSLERSWPVASGASGRPVSRREVRL